MYLVHLDLCSWALRQLRLYFLIFFVGSVVMIGLIEGGSVLSIVGQSLGLTLMLCAMFCVLWVLAELARNIVAIATGVYLDLDYSRIKVPAFYSKAELKRFGVVGSHMMSGMSGRRAGVKQSFFALLVFAVVWVSLLLMTVLAIAGVANAVALYR